jgi:Family of unknown function (DUF5681)
MTANKPLPGQKIGFGKPPVSTRFKPGKSGNPAGRPKGTRNLSSDVKRTLQAKIRLKDNGKPRKVSAQEALLMRLREKALKGDSRSLDRLLSYARIFNNDSEETMPKGSMAEEDQAILDAYAAEIRANADRDSEK